MTPVRTEGSVVGNWGGHVHIQLVETNKKVQTEVQSKSPLLEGGVSQLGVEMRT